MNTAFANGATLPEELQRGEISCACADLLNFWKEVNEIGQGPKWEQMGDQLNLFCRTLSEHFARDEDALQDSGIVRDVGHQRFYELQFRSRQILDQLIDDIDHLKSRDATYEKWSQVAEELQDIMDRVAEHERLVSQMNDALSA